MTTETWLGTCDHCKLFTEVSIPASLTQYQTELPDDHPDSPNYPGILCADCAEEYRKYWQAMWEEYYAACYY